jgi:hypothetical protein
MCTCKHREGGGGEGVEKRQKSKNIPFQENRLNKLLMNGFFNICNTPSKKKRKTISRPL